jgi:AraC-like DNA-binding protein
MRNLRREAALTPAGSAPLYEAGLRHLAHARTDAPSIAMGITAGGILGRPALSASLQKQAQALVLAHQARPRVASPFATQQRWLMSQVALAKYFRNEAEQAGSGVLAERFIELVLNHDLACRNTAGAFLQEMLKYGIVRHVADCENRRHRPFEPSPGMLAMLLHWLAIHLTTLDGLDGGRRLASLQSRPELLAAMQPVIADGLLASCAVRKPDRTFSLLTWINQGGILMDSLIAGCRDDTARLTRIPTDLTSVSALSKNLKMSRTQLSRKFLDAEASGCLGWTHERGRSPLWVSADFVRQYHVAQAVKLAVIDAAFGAAQAHPCRSSVRRHPHDVSPALMP